MTQKKFQRLSVKVGVEINQKLDELALKLGMSKSGLVSYFIGQGIKLEGKREEMTSPEYLSKLFSNMPEMLALLEKENKKYDEED